MFQNFQFSKISHILYAKEVDIWSTHVDIFLQGVLITPWIRNGCHCCHGYQSNAKLQTLSWNVKFCKQAFTTLQRNTPWTLGWLSERVSDCFTSSGKYFMHLQTESVEQLCPPLPCKQQKRKLLIFWLQLFFLQALWNFIEYSL